MTRKHFLLPILAALTTGAAAQSNHPIDLGANDTYIRSNTGPDCGCFALNGGGAVLQYGLTRHLPAVADLNVTHASNITPEGYTLTQTAYTFGSRYTPVAPEYQSSPSPSPRRLSPRLRHPRPLEHRPRRLQHLRPPDRRRSPRPTQQPPHA